MGDIGKKVTPGLTEYLALLALALMWSSSFMFIKVAVASVPPVTVAAGRIAIAAAGLWLLMRLQGQRLPRDPRDWLLILTVGAIGNGAAFLLIGWGEIRIDSSLAAILIATTPLIAFLMGHVVTTDERLTRPRLLGVIVGFSGVVLLIGPANLTALGGETLSQLAVIGGGACYAIAAFVTRRISPMPQSVLATAVLLCATVLMVPLSVAIDRPWTLQPTTGSVLSIIVLGVTSTGVASLILFWLIRRTGATFVSLNNYMNPVLGVLWGALFLAEMPSRQTLAGLVIITFGLVMTNLRLGRHGAAQPPPVDARR